jgi:hypothetical protein
VELIGRLDHPAGASSRLWEPTDSAVDWELSL